MSEKDANLLEGLIGVLSRHVAERGYEDDPIEVLKRIIAERDSGAFAKVNQAAAILGFAGWLSCREEAVTFGSTHECSVIAELVEEFRKAQEFAEPRDGWNTALKPYPVSKDFYKKILTPRTTAAIEEAGPIPHMAGYPLDASLEEASVLDRAGRLTFAEVVALLAPRPHIYILILDGIEEESVAVYHAFSGVAVAEVLIAMSRPLARRVENLIWNFCGRRLPELTETTDVFQVVDGKVLVPVMTTTGLTEVRLVLQPIAEEA